MIHRSEQRLAPKLDFGSNEQVAKHSLPQCSNFSLALHFVGFGRWGRTINKLNPCKIWNNLCPLLKNLRGQSSGRIQSEPDRTNPGLQKHPRIQRLEHTFESVLRSK